MLADYRLWLETELRLLSNASNHEYSFGQAAMAKRALERFEQTLRGRVALTFERGRVDAVLTALEELAERETALDPALEALRSDLQTARLQVIG
jgi:uncharacterized protein YicC (UPF0701 family)